jgi:hypothetical protein
VSRPAPLVVALVETVLVDESAGDVAAQVAQTAGILERKIAGMPRIARFGMAVLMLFFDWSGLLHAGRRFRHQTRSQRAAQLSVWRGSSVGLFRDFVSFFRRMGTFVWYSVGSEE